MSPHKIASAAAKAKFTSGHDSDSSSSHEDIIFDAILYAKVHVSDANTDDEIAEMCDERLDAGKTEAGVEWDDGRHRCGRHRYGNRAGIDKMDAIDLQARRLDTVMETIAQMQKQTEKTEKDAADGKRETNTLKAEVQILKATSKPYLAIRSGFISVYKRNKFPGPLSDEDQNTIDQRNFFAHDGDALTDALMFEEKVRTDASSFMAIYSMAPMEVLQYRDQPAITELLSEFATVKAKDYNASQEFHSSYHSFLSALRDDNSETPFLEDESRALTRAYRTFWKEHDKIPENLKVKGDKREHTSSG